jgi:tetratricopeptide (TPR) repeat protein
MALEDHQRLAEALAAYEAAVRARPEMPETRANLAGMLGRMGELDRAERLYREVLATRPDLPVARLGMEELERARSRRPPPSTRGSDVGRASTGGT